MSQKRVLIVEDDVWLGELFELVLQHQCVVERVTSAEAAIDMIDTFQPQLLVLDLVLGGANGIALVHELQSYHDTSQLPIILCTSVNLPAQAQQSLAAYGIKKVLNKATMTPRLLRQAVEAIVV